MTLAELRYKPEYSITINGEPLPVGLAGLISSVSHQSGLEGADRVEIAFANALQLMDHPLFALDGKLTLSLGYAPDPLKRVFVGEIVGYEASFPSDSAPSLMVVAQDRLHRFQRPQPISRWFALPIPIANVSIPDPLIFAMVSAENFTIPVVDLLGSAIAHVLQAVEVAGAVGNPQDMQKLVQRQEYESDYGLLMRMARENGWEIFIDHAGIAGGFKLRMMTPARFLKPDIVLRYGRSLIDFNPRFSTVGQILGVTGNVWISQIKLQLSITLSYDLDRNAFDITVKPGFGIPADVSEVAVSVLDTSAKTPASAPRLLVSKLLPKLYERLTAEASVVGDPDICAGCVLQIEGVGERFGGRFRATDVNQTVDGNGFITNVKLRWEPWFQSIPSHEQGAVPIRFQGQRIGSVRSPKSGFPPMFIPGS